MYTYDVTAHMHNCIQYVITTHTSIATANITETGSSNTTARYQSNLAMKVVTSDSELSGALCHPQRVVCNDLVLSNIFGAHSEDEHGADTTCVGDVVVGVSVEADVVVEPCDVWPGVPSHSTAHVALVALRRSMHLQRNQELGWAL